MPALLVPLSASVFGTGHSVAQGLWREAFQHLPSSLRPRLGVGFEREALIGDPDRSQRAPECRCDLVPVEDSRLPVPHPPCGLTAEQLFLIQHIEDCFGEHKQIALRVTRVSGRTPPV